MSLVKGIKMKTGMSIVLSVRQLKKTYPPKKRGGRPFTAVNNVSFDLKQGEILGLLGPNGAGKSTTIQMLMSTLTPTAGEITYFGQSLEKNRSQIMEHVTFASTYVKMPWRLTVIENLQIYSLLYGLTSSLFFARAEKFLKFFGVWNQRSKAMSQLSAGQITRIMLAKAFIPHPKIVLLDEPTASLDPDIAHLVRKFVKQQQSKYGVSILYTSHNMNEVAEVCDRVIFLQKGKIVAHDTPENLAKSVSSARLRLWVSDGLKRTAQHIKDQGWPVQIENRQVVIELDEVEIAGFLAVLASDGIEYTQISIDKPTLEDYFLNLSSDHQQRRGK